MLGQPIEESIIWSQAASLHDSTASHSLFGMTGGEGSATLPFDNSFCSVSHRAFFIGRVRCHWPDAGICRGSGAHGFLFHWGEFVPSSGLHGWDDIMIGLFCLMCFQAHSEGQCRPQFVLESRNRVVAWDFPGFQSLTLVSLPACSLAW